jgi:hypothetical protein
MYILCDSSNNKNACDKVILHAEKEENFVHKTGGHFRVKTATSRTVMRTAMDRTRVVRTNLPISQQISQQISPQTNPQTKLLTAITKSSSTENKSLHNM